MLPCNIFTLQDFCMRLHLCFQQKYSQSDTHCQKMIDGVH